MVSIISMPDTVALFSLAESRICTRVRLMRFWEMYQDTPAFTAMVARPTSVICQLYRIMTVR